MLISEVWCFSKIVEALEVIAYLAFDQMLADSSGSVYSSLGQLMAPGV